MSPRETKSVDAVHVEALLEATVAVAPTAATSPGPRDTTSVERGLVETLLGGWQSLEDPEWGTFFRDPRTGLDWWVVRTDPSGHPHFQNRGGAWVLYGVVTGRHY